jgi:hypothetical protein
MEAFKKITAISKNLTQKASNSIQNLIKGNKPKTAKNKTHKIRSKLEPLKKFGQEYKDKDIVIFQDICSNAGLCISFGDQTYKIRKFFEGFSNFKYVDPTQIKRIGNDSANGIVLDIPFMKQGYSAHAILKTSQTLKNKQSDSIIYEAFVGAFINKKVLIYPCFMETYGVYRSKDKAYNFSKTSSLNRDQFLKNLQSISIYADVLSNTNIIQDACDHSYSILIQNIKDAKTLNDYITNKSYRKDTMFLNVELVHYLFQVYYPLSMMADDFTHYDLHTGNVMIYKPALDKKHYLKMKYENVDGTFTEFFTYGISKMIDYGRCYVEDKSVKGRSTEFYKNVCDVLKDCGETCGYNYEYMNNKNISQDLRLLHIFSRYTKSYSLKSDLFSKIKIKFDTDYFTNEVVNSNWKQLGDTIKNVHDAYKTLLLWMSTPEYQNEYNKEFAFASETSPDCLGELAIFQPNNRGIKKHKFTRNDKYNNNYISVSSLSSSIPSNHSNQIHVSKKASTPKLAKKVIKKKSKNNYVGSYHSKQRNVFGTVSI